MGDMRKDYVSERFMIVSKNKKSEVISLTTLEKKSVSKIKAKLISYVS